MSAALTEWLLYFALAVLAVEALVRQRRAAADARLAIAANLAAAAALIVAIRFALAGFYLGIWLAMSVALAAHLLEVRWSR